MLVRMLATDNNSRMGNLATPKQKKTTPEGLAMGKRILRMREERGRVDENFKNLTWFAEQAGTSSGTISRYEGGERHPATVDDEIMARVAGLLGVRSRWLRYGEEPQELTAEPEIVFDLTHYLWHHIRNKELVAEVVKDPTRWPPHVLYQANVMGSAEGHEGLSPLQRLKHAENALKNSKFDDPDKVDRILLREYAALRPARVKKPKQRDKK